MRERESDRPGIHRSRSTAAPLIVGLTIGLAGLTVAVAAFRGGGHHGAVHTRARITALPSETPSSTDQPAPNPSNSHLPNVPVPAPPPEYNFSTEDHGGLIDAIGNWHVFFAAASAEDPQTLEAEVTSLLDYYQQAMPNDGWTLRERTPVHYSEGSDYPPESRFGVEVWSRGDQAVWMEIESWAPWQGRGWQLNMLFRLGDTRLPTPAPSAASDATPTANPDVPQILPLGVASR